MLVEVVRVEEEVQACLRQEVWSSYACCRRANVEVFASSDRELGRHAAGLEAWKRLPQEVWRCAAGVQDALSGSDVEVFASRDLDVRRHAAGVAIWRYGGLEVWRRITRVAT